MAIKRIKGNSKRNVLRGSQANDMLMGFAGNDKLLGLVKQDRLLGGDGNDFLDGGKSKDVLIGGKGNDTYTVDHLKDAIKERAGQGTDTVRAAFSYVLGANLENLTLTGKQSINGTGNALANKIIGNAGNNIIDGGAGADTMIGGEGNDIYYVDNAKDVVIELPNGGIDIVRTTLANFALPANVEFLEYIGTGNFNITASNTSGTSGSSTGTSTGSTITSGSGNDRISGANGNDTLSSGDGNDSVDGGAGNDVVDGGGGDDNLGGGDGDDTIVGGTGNDLLDGGLGIDKLIGGLGDDTYVVDNALDQVEELAGAGIDLVKSAIDYVLRDNLENLELLAGAVKGTGNDLANRILGNDAGNILDGGLGADSLIGGLGDDTYLVDNALDVTEEAIGAGNDLVKSTVDHVLRDNLENLELIGGNLNGTGNNLANKILGTAGNNILSGGAGNDSLLGGEGADKLIGGAGIDELTGGAGIDVFALKELGQDLLTDFNPAEDIIALDKATYGLTSLLGSTLGASEFATVANDALAQAGATVLNPLARILYSSETGKIFFDGNGLLAGLGNGGVVAQVKDSLTGTAPALSNLNFVIDAIA